MESQKDISGTFQKKFSQPNKDWCSHLIKLEGNYTYALPIELSGKTFITITGYGLPVSKTPVKYFGNWKKDGKFGWQFEVQNFEFLKPSSRNGIIDFLSSSLFKGIGKKQAENIVAEFGEDTLKIIEKEPAKLLNANGMTPEKLSIIERSYKNNFGMSELVAFGATIGLNRDIVLKIYEAFGKDSKQRIQTNPFSILDIPGIGFITCEKIAKALNVRMDCPERIIGAIKTELHKAQSSGNMYLRDEYLKENVMYLLNEGVDSECQVSSDRYDEILKQYQNGEELVRRSGAALFLKEGDYAEYRITQELLNLKNGIVPEETKKRIDIVVDEINQGSSIKLSANQCAAVKKSLNNYVSIITGGPGTGKTTILTTIIKAYKRVFGNPVTLVSPTGIAAKRMATVTHEDAHTIHSALKIRGDVQHLSEVQDANMEKLPIGLIVVDESSMIDTYLVYKLMLSIEKGSHLIFIGDVDQLPSVGPGKVLEDLIKSEAIETSRLIEVFRQKNGGGYIIDNARKINSGDTNLEFQEGFELVDASTEDDALDKILQIYKDEVKKVGVSQVALLCPLRSAQEGRIKVCSDAINKNIQNAINPISGNMDSYTFKGVEFRTFDRVMEWKNTPYAANGDVGTILSISLIEGEPVFTILFENGNTARLGRDAMSTVTLAYSMSVHKSQGSEYNTVIIPMLSCQLSKLHRRNMLYTAVTRAKKKVIIVGDKKAVDYCITHCDSSDRRTMLKDRLKYNLSKQQNKLAIQS